MWHVFSLKICSLTFTKHDLSSLYETFTVSKCLNSIIRESELKTNTANVSKAWLKISMCQWQTLVPMDCLADHQKKKFKALLVKS